MQSYFIWNGVDSRSMGLTSKGHAPRVRPEERVEHVAIPGRSGDLTELEGENIYNSYIQTVSFSVPGSRVNALYRWMRGGGYVTFSGEPDKQQKARVIGAITLDRVSRNLDRWTGSAQFYCQPLKERVFDTPATLTEAGTLRNAGDVAARPVIVATPTQNAEEIAITVNGQTLAVTGFSGAVIIDSGAMAVTNIDRTVILTQHTAGQFPVLAVGSNIIGGSGWASLEITKNERFL